MFFFFNMIPTITDKIIDTTVTVIIELVSVDKLPRGIFIPKNDDIIVGTDITIVNPAKNFIAMFKLFEVMVAQVLEIDDKTSLYIFNISYKYHKITRNMT